MTHHFPLELKQCCEFLLTRDRDSYPPPCIDPRHIHLALGVQRWIICAECNPLYKINLDPVDDVSGFPTTIIFWKVTAGA